jgi:hypothetical protein
MFNAGQMELQSDRWLRGNTSDRPSFNALICRGFGGERRFQVFAMSKGLLCLDKGPPRSSGGGGGGDNTGAIVAGAVVGGLVGAMVVSALTSNVPSAGAGSEERFDLCSEQELLDLARARKKSFVAFYDQITGISLDVPGFFGKMFGDSRTVGWITLREKTLGKVAMEIREASEMCVAMESLPRRLGNRVQVNLQLDPRTRTSFVRK